MTEHIDLMEDTENEPRSDTDEADDTEEIEPVEFLVQLAERGKIEPWDIDIVSVTDTFLAALDGSDLRAGGRALFYASVLLRMKSDALMQDDAEEEEEMMDEWEEQWETQRADGKWDGEDPFDTLEQEMERRLDRKRARGTPRTLDELVRELRDRERNSWWKESRTYDTSDSPHGTQTLDYRADDGVRMDDEPTESDVTGTAHTEDIETTIQHVYRVLCEHYDRDRNEVLYTEIKETGDTPVETFLALLFLAHREQIRLQQDELFGDLWIQNPATMPAAEEAIVD